MDLVVRVAALPFEVHLVLAFGPSQTSPLRLDAAGRLCRVAVQIGPSASDARPSNGNISSKETL